MTNKELLTEMRVDIKWIKKTLDSHLKLHERRGLAWLTAGVAAIVAIVVAVLW